MLGTIVDERQERAAWGGGAWRMGTPSRDAFRGRPPTERRHLHEHPLLRPRPRHSSPATRGSPMNDEQRRFAQEITDAVHLRHARSRLDWTRAAALCAGEERVEPHSFLEFIATLGEAREHDIDSCAHCCELELYAAVARDMLRAERFDAGVFRDLLAEQSRRWEQTKFSLLWKRCVQTGVDPREAFRKNGWEF